MIESYCRSYYQKYLVDPVILRLNKIIIIHPLYVTLLGCWAGLLAAALIFLHHPWAAVIALCLSGYLDTLDGSLARANQMVSAKGAIFDIVMDRLVEFFVVFALVAIDLPSRAIVGLCMLGSILICVSSFLVVGIFEKNESEKSFHYSVGLMERAEAFIFFALMILLPHWFVLLAWVFVVLVCVTTIHRLYTLFGNVC